MILVFSDLDGTLLDHESYSFEPARPALDRLAARSIPLVLASSKTACEMRPIARAMGIDYPMIVENGAGIVFPDTATESESDKDSYKALRDCLSRLPAELHGLFEGFGDWTVEEVAAKTGLDRQAAALARQRCFSEPGLFSGAEDQKRDFQTALAQHGYQAVQGGRFFTIMPKTSKAVRMKELVQHYTDMSGEAVRSIALGDAPNDLAMLEAADCGVIIANPAHGALPVTEREKSGHILRSEKAGPEGWNEMIMTLV